MNSAISSALRRLLDATCSYRVVLLPGVRVGYAGGAVGGAAGGSPAPGSAGGVAAGGVPGGVAGGVSKDTRTGSRSAVSSTSKYSRWVMWNMPARITEGNVWILVFHFCTVSL